MTSLNCELSFYNFFSSVGVVGFVILGPMSGLGLNFFHVLGAQLKSLVILHWAI